MENSENLDAGVLAQWSEWYPDAPPVAFLVRDAYPELWLRIHSLPESKRYAENTAEHLEVLRRQNAVATEVLGSGTECELIVLARCDSNLDALVSAAGLNHVGLTLLGPLKQEVSEEYFDGSMCFFGASIQWQTGSFDLFLRSVADDETNGLLIELEHGRVYAPYDGGADLFFVSELERDLAANKFRAWLSDREDGL